MFRKNSGPSYSRPYQETMQALQHLGQVRPKDLGTTVVKSLALKNLDQVPEVKRELKSGNMLILDAAALMENTEFSIIELKRAIEQVRAFVKELGGSMGRLGDQYLILTPSPNLRLSF
ncbi:MAG: cell division protein SepF [Promethearchaeota archaeon]